jgi:cell division protein FtsL
VRAAKEKHISLFNFLLGLFLSAGVLVFFVYNIISVNELAVQNNNLHTEINKSITINNGLQTEIEKLSNFDNIKPVAVDKLGLRVPNVRPKKISVNKSELENIK